jgi:hypothetical protein
MAIMQANQGRLDPAEIRENMERKASFVLKDAVGRDELVTIAALITEPECLYWRDAWHDPQKPPIEYPPKINDDGVCAYRMCLDYARRLIASEPYKYKLLDPDVIKVKMPTVNGGEETVVVYAHIVKKEGGQIIRDKNNGLPVLIPNPKVVEAYKASLKG